MKEAVFLSASIPDPKRAPNYAATADAVAIGAAVNALVHVILGRRPLIWGGHPAITPMVWAVAEGLSVDYGAWVQLYQSQFFKDEYPEDNARFKNVTYTSEVVGDRDRSLTTMRQKMFGDHSYSAAVFIGGMSGIVEEFNLFHQLQPNAKLVPVASTGGASIDLADKTGAGKDLREDLDYVAVFHRHLEISVREERFKMPSEQPASVEQRMFKSQVPRPVQ
jgi:hypothetical protein